MTINEFAVTDGWAPTDAQRAALAAGDQWIDLYLEPGSRVDADALALAIDTVMSECPVLHSVFRGAPGTVRVCETAPTPTEVLAADGGDPDRLVASWLAQERSRTTDLDRGPLYRHLVVGFANGRVGWFQRYHRLVNDEPGMLAIVARVRALLDGTRSDPPACPPFGPAADRLESERRYRESGSWATDRHYWEQSLAGADRPAPLSGHGPDLPDPAAGGLWSETAAGTELTRIARACGGGPPAVVLAAVAVYASRMTMADDVVIAVGNVDGAVPLRISVSPQTSFDGLAKRVGLELRRARRHRYIPDIDDPWPEAPVHGQWPLAVRMLPDAAPGRLHEPDSRVSFGTGDPVTVCVDDGAVGGWRIAVVGTGHRTHRDRIVRLLDRLARAPRTPIGRIALTGPMDTEYLEGARTDAPPTTVAALLAAQAARTPDAVALVSGERRMTYADLHDASNTLARSLIHLGVGPERPVAVAIGPSPEQIVAVHAVLAAGGAYLPLDPEHPRERHAYLLDVTRPVCVLGTRRDGFDAPPGVRVIHLDDLDLSGESRATVTDVDRIAPLRPDNLAYVLFTSGSTGRPKGVGVTHAALCTHLAWMQHEHALDGGDAVLRKTSLTFDVSAWEVLWPFLSGARVVVDESGAHRDPAGLARLLAEYGVTTVQFTPSTLAAHRRAAAEPFAASVRRVLVAGEALTPALAAQLPATAPGARYDNLYGPTEATVAVTRHEIAAAQAFSPDDTVPIGTPSWDVRAHVLDHCLQPVPAGASGELYIGGAALARGYVGGPGRTAARFVADPFGDPGRRLYRTGDIVRATALGELEFLGRSDFQVKLRGIRVELGELESVLAGQETVAQAVAVVRRGDHTAGDRLVAYVTPAAGHRIDPAELERRLGEVLPRHLIPASIVALTELPVNRSGKIDRKALPEPVFEPVPFRAPRTTTERTLAAVFADVLGRDTVGVDESFFALGGDSIMSILLVSRARARGIAITAQEVYEHRTVARLATVAEAADGCDTPRLDEPPGGGVGELPLTPVIRFLVERGGNFDRFCQSLTLELPDGIDRAAMVSTISAVVDHHDMLRSRLSRDDAGEWHLTVSPPGSIDVDALIDQVFYDADLSGTELAAFATEQLNAAVDRIDPATGAVLRFVWLTPRRSASPGLLVIAAHHIAVDGVSWRILLPDFVSAWAAVAAGSTPRLPGVGTSMRAWTHALVDTARRPELVAELPVWREIVDGPAPTFGDRPFDPHRDLTPDVAHTAIELDERDTAALITAIPGRYRARVADALLTALALAVARWRSRRDQGERSVLLRLEGHGREQDAVPGADLSRTVGWFTSIVPARLDLAGIDLDDAFAGGPALGDALKAVKEQLRRTPHNGFGYGLLRYLNEETAATLPREEPGEISFNYFGHITGVDIPDELSGIGWLPSPDYGMLPIRPDARRGALGAVEVDSIVVGHRLRTSIGYARTLFDEASGEELIRLWREALTAVARHARDPRTRGGHTPSDFPLTVPGQADIDLWERRYPALTDVWPVSPLQAGIMFHALFDPAAVDVYTVQLVLTLDGAVDTAGLRSAADTVLERHPNLRTAFVVDGAGSPRQIVVAEVALPWRTVDLTGAPAGELDRLLDTERVTPFDLERPPLLRFLLVREDAGRTRLVLTYHHLLLDGWSIPLLLREIVAGYAGFATEPPRPYRHYLEWLARQDKSESRRAWAEALGDVPEPTLLAGDPPARPPAVLPPEHEFVLDEAQTRALTRLAGELEVTVNTVLQCAWAILLSRMTDRSDVVFGTTVSGRPADITGVESMVGLFINTIPVRVRMVADDTAQALLRRVQREQFALSTHHHLGLPDIVSQADSGKRGLFDTLLVVESYPFDVARLRTDATAGAGLAISGLRSREATHYALTITVRQTDRLHILASRRPDLVDEATVARLTERLVGVLSALAANPYVPVAHIDAIGPAERQLVLEHWQRPAAHAADTTLVDLFLAQVAARPDAVAVRHGSRAVTYRELDRASAELSHALAARGIGPESLVALAVSRSIELITGMLGVLRAGAGYVPLDLDSPPRRLEFVLAETDPSCVVTTRADRAALPAGDLPCLILGAEEASAPTSPAATPRPGNLAYVLYTSGSTGRPKGVCVTHRNVVAMLTAARSLLDTDHTDVWTMFHSPAFDFSVWEMWGALSSGGTLAIVDPDLARSPVEFGELLERDAVTVLSQTPSAFYALLDAGATAPPSLRHIVLGGEALDLRRLRGWYDASPAGQTRISNLYGITEATVHATHVPVDGALARSARASVIGLGLPGMTVRVLDSRLRPVPVGATGEVYLTGDQVARGYHARPATTAARYVADPFGVPGGVMFRTGDLARWNNDGSLEYRGRGDQQVKIRGYRIEPAEVEAALLDHDSVAQAVVVARAEGPSPRLIAYTVPASGRILATGELETHVAHRLPPYMRPSAIVAVEALPLTPNGKLDRAALPDPVFRPRSAQAPRTPAEQVIADVFAEVLGIDRAGVDDSFFALGGDSITSIQLASRARARGLHFTPRDVFDHRTVAGIASAARTSDSDPAVPRLLELPGGGVGELPLPPAVRWLTERGGSFRRVNQTLTVDLPPGIDHDTVAAAVAAIVDRHDMLRGRLFRDGFGEWRLETAPPGAIGTSELLRRYDIDFTSEAAALDAALDRLDPAAGIMVQFVRLDSGHGTGRLIICAHHIAVDGVSWRILIPDLLAAMAAIANHAAPQWDPPGTSMRRWSHALVDAAHAPDRIAELGLWRRICAAPDPALGPRPLDPDLDTVSRLATVDITVDQADTESLVRTVPALFHAGVDEILVSALAVALTTWRARRGEAAPVSLIRLEGHGREEQLAPGADLSRTVGWCTSLYPVRLDLTGIDVEGALAGTESAGAVIKAVKEQLRAVPDHGVGYGLLRYLNPDTAELLPGPMPGQIAFNYLGRIHDRGSGVVAMPAADADPDLPAAAAIDVNAIVVDSRLRAGFSYPTTLLDKSEVADLAELWVAALGAIISHARDSNAGGHTPSDFPLVRVSRGDIAGWERDYGRLTEVWPLAPLQQGLYFHAELARPSSPGSTVVDVYNVQAVQHIGGVLDRDRLRWAADELLRRYPNLRAAFVADTTGTPRQVVPETVEIPWREVDLRLEGRVSELIDRERTHRFDPAVPPLMRFALARTADSEHVLIATYHHILLDGWSVPLVLRDLMALYASGEPLAPPAGSFRAYLAWHHDRETTAAAAAWRRALDGVRGPTLVAPTARGHDITTTTKYRWVLDADTTDRLGATATELGVTVNTVLQVAWAILLGRRLGRDDVVFGTIVSGRPAALPGVESVVGLCINTVPVRVRFDPGMPAAAVLRSVQDEQAELMEHHDLGLTAIHAAAGQRDILFDTAMVYESYPVDVAQLAAAAAAVDGIAGTAVELHDAAHYPLTLFVEPGPALTIQFGYQRTAFDETQVAEIAAELRNLLRAVAAAPQDPIEALR